MKHHEHVLSELEEKCSKVTELKSKCFNIPLNTSQKQSFFDYISKYVKICDHLRESYKEALGKSKRSALIDNDVTPEFSKLYAFKNYVLELQMDDF